MKRALVADELTAPAPNASRAARTPLAPRPAPSNRILPESTPRILSSESSAPPVQSAEAKELQELNAELGGQRDLDAVLQQLAQAKRKMLDLQIELSKAKEQHAETLAARKTEKGLADTERRRADMKLSEAVQKQKELTTALDEMEARHVEERDKASKIENTLRTQLAAITAESGTKASMSFAPAASTPAVEKEARALKAEVEVLTAERDMLKNQVEKQATRIDALMRDSHEAVALRHKTREQEATLDQLTAVSAGTDDRDALIAQLRSEVAHLAKADDKAKALLSEVTMLRERAANTQVLKEQVADLKKRLERAEKTAQRAEELQVERDLLAKEKREWDAAVASGPLVGVSSPAQLARIVSDLRKENEVLIEKNGQLAAKQKRLQLRVAEVSSVESKAAALTVGRQVKDASHSQQALEKALAVLQRDRDNLRAVVDTYVSDEPTANEEVLRKRVAQLEDTLKEKTDLLSELLKKAQNAAPEASTAQAQLDHTRVELEQAKNENAKLMEELGKVEAKLLKGEFDPKTTKILHMTINPETRALAGKDKLELETLRKENAMLREQKTAAPSVSVSEEDLKRELKALEVKYDRLSKAIKKQMKDVREASYQLFGYALDINYSEGSQTYKVRCMYSDNADDHLVFCSSREGIVLIDSEWGRTLQSTIETYLIRDHSIPAFLSAVLLDLFAKRSMS